MLVAAAAVSFAALPGCSLQGEGERCNLKNNGGDCSAGLVCTSALDLGGQSDICCPADGTSDHPGCIPGNFGSTSTTSGTTTTGTGGAGQGGAGGSGQGGAGGSGEGGAGGAGQGGAGGSGG